MGIIRPLTVTLSVAGLFWGGMWLNAAAQGGGQITIDPFYQEITLDPKAPSKTYRVKITNNSSQPHIFKIKTADFGSLNETGGVAFIGVAKPDLNYKYGLTPWLSLDEDLVSLDPGQTRQISFRVTKVDSLSPGGHYGAILVTTDTGSSEDKSKVQISPVVSSLILLKKIGGEVYGIKLESADVKRSFLGLPAKAAIRFANNGNTHIVPRGTVTITDMKGSIISEALINSESGYILPGNIRQLQSSLRDIKTAWLPGYYNLNISYRYDGNDDFNIKTTRFFYIGQGVKAAAILGVILAAIWLIIKPKKLIKSWSKK